VGFETVLPAVEALFVCRTIANKAFFRWVMVAMLLYLLCRDDESRVVQALQQLHPFIDVMANTAFLPCESMTCEFHAILTRRGCGQKLGLQEVVHVFLRRQHPSR
jgi:hypothetical protein